ncbi:hypothetical protein KY084_11800 [Stakelama sp. CBK3Z-3]|uniref:Integron n=1 Tax=Stakelama flava TaxID=2860338 RepID=A0ABS6XMV8_9SPHN|nr:hypothetical protein [Stakelama flava]MBW4331552.1 hypothetical protein [Stakelama flava]
MRFILPLATLALMLSACQSGTPITPENDSQTSDAAVDQPLSPGARPVRIGENGANFAACGARGIVTIGEDKNVPLRAAPFDEADQVTALKAGQRMFICTRSIDQRWLGVVVPQTRDGTSASADCGVNQRVERPQAYTGPCPSGWIANALVRLTAD